MANVFEEFSKLWSPRTVTAPAPVVDEQADTESRIDSIRDMRVFIATKAYRDFRAWIDHEIDMHSPKPEMGTDVGSCYTFKREGLIASRQRLDAMVRLAEEKLNDA